MARPSALTARPLGHQEFGDVLGVQRIDLHGLRNVLNVMFVFVLEDEGQFALGPVAHGALDGDAAESREAL
jgi:hypothetical protein